MEIKDEIELLRELLNKAIEMEADTDEIIKISQMLDKQIVAYMTSPSYQHAKFTKNNEEDVFDNEDEDA